MKKKFLETSAGLQKSNRPTSIVQAKVHRKKLANEFLHLPVNLRKLEKLLELPRELPER